MRLVARVVRAYYLAKAKLTGTTLYEAMDGKLLDLDEIIFEMLDAGIDGMSPELLNRITPAQYLAVIAGPGREFPEKELEAKLRQIEAILENRRNTHEPKAD